MFFTRENNKVCNTTVKVSKSLVVYDMHHAYGGMTMHSPPATALISVRCGCDNVCVATLEHADQRTTLYR